MLRTKYFSYILGKHTETPLESWRGCEHMQNWAGKTNQNDTKLGESCTHHQRWRHPNRGSHTRAHERTPLHTRAHAGRVTRRMTRDPWRAFHCFFFAWLAIRRLCCGIRRLSCRQSCRRYVVPSLRRRAMRSCRDLPSDWLRPTLRQYAYQATNPICALNYRS